MSRADCSRCGVRVALLSTGRVRSHQCPHGHYCVRSLRHRPSPANRWRTKPCPECFAQRQLSLPLENTTP